MLKTLIRKLKQVSKYALAHKVMSAIVAVVVLGGGYWTYQKLHPTSTQTRYVLGTVARGTIIATVSGSGQVSSSNSIDIKPQVSGTILWVGAKAGDKVGAGQALMTIDNTTAAQTLANTKKNLEASLLQYQKDSAQAPINFQNDQHALSTAKENLAEDYNDIYNDLTSAYLDLPAVMSGAENTVYGYDFDMRRSQNNVDVLLGVFTNQDTTIINTFQKTAKTDYTTARDSYNTSLATYQKTLRTSSGVDIENLLSQTITTVTNAAQTLQTELNFLNAVADLAQTYNLNLPAKFTTVQSNTRTYLSTATDDLSTLLADKKALDAGKQAITNAEQTLTLDQVGNPNGSNPISLQISKNSIEKAQQDIANQESDLAKYTIRAPFSGTLATVSAKKGDSAGSGAVATIISTSQVATLSLNEIDATKIKLGNKATLTFDAIDGLTITGSVAEIDAIGTVSQGVVSYDIKISFDAQDTRVKPGMTVNAQVQTDVRQNVLTVPASAVKTLSGASFVQVFNPPLPNTGGTTGVTSETAPQNIPVEVGISDDTATEIHSGLNEGQQIVTRTVNGTAVTTTAGATGGAARGGGLGGGAVIRAF